MSKISPSDRVRLASQLVTQFKHQFDGSQYQAILKQFGVDTARAADHLFESLLEDTDDARLADLGRHFDLDVPDAQPENADGTSVPLDADAYTELVSAETALREVIRLAVPNWMDDVSPDELDKLKAKHAEEDKRRDGITVSRDLLDYTDLHQLAKTISKHWNPAVQAILDDKKRTDVYLDIIRDIRNSVGHSRPVYRSERLLLAGAAGQIRNQLAAYRGQHDGPANHYARIDSGVDDTGRTGYRPNPRGGFYIPLDAFDDIPRLSVGETVTFHLEATDVRGRDLHWKAVSFPASSGLSFALGPYSSLHSSNIRRVAEATGDRVTLDWTLTDQDVGENRHVATVVANAGTFHRESGGWDDVMVFAYHVNPPPRLDREHAVAQSICGLCVDGVSRLAVVVGVEPVAGFSRRLGRRRLRCGRADNPPGVRRRHHRLSAPPSATLAEGRRDHPTRCADQPLPR